jgi:hypothetical protein
MDIDAINTTINAMSYEERGEFLKKGLCFNCKQQGHISRDCPKKDPRRSTSNAVNAPRYSQNKSSTGYRQETRRQGDGQIHPHYEQRRAKRTIRQSREGRQP